MGWFKNLLNRIRGKEQPKLPEANPVGIEKKWINIELR